MALNVGELYASFGIDSKGLDKQLSTIEKKCGSMGKTLALVGAGMTAALTRPLMKMGKSIYEAGTNFEAQMSKVEAISGASGKSLEALTSKALEMGSTTQFTATEAGQALEYMAMAGWKDESMLAGLEPIMNLAAAAGGDLASTSDIVTDAMTAFGYTLDSVGGDTEAFNKQITHFSDVLAAASTNANTNVQMMGESFKYVAPLAGTMGYTIDDIAVALGTMANAGIKGSQAGTSLQRIMQNMIKPTKAQSKAMKALGLSLTDSNGKNKSWAEVMTDMRNTAKKSGLNLKELSENVAEYDRQLANGEITQKQYDRNIKKLTKGNDKFLKNVAEISGTRGLAAMLSIMNASDAEFDALTESILHCDGATAKMAQTMLDNAKGDVTIFKSALEGLSITLWTDVAPAFREVVQALTRYTDSFRKSSASNRAGVMKMAALAAAAGPVTAALGGIVAALPKMGTALLSLASPVGIVLAGLGLFAAAAISDNNDIGQAFYRMTYNVRKTLTNFNSTLKKKMVGASERMGRLVGSISDGMRQLIPEIMKTITTVVGGLMDAISENADAIAEVGMTIIEGVLGGLSDAMPELIPAAAGMVTSILSTLIENAPRLLMAAELLGQKIIAGILETDWLKLGGNLLDSISKAISSGATNAQAIGNKIIKMINTYLTPENISNLLTNATAFAEKLFNTITSAFTTTEDTGVDVVGKIVEALNTALGKISGAEFTGKLGKLAEAVINGIVDSIVSLGVAGSDLLVNIINGISTILGNITSTDFDNVDAVAQSIMDAISTGIGKLGLAGSEIVANIGTAIGKLLGKIGTGDFTEGAGKLATTLIKGLGTAIGQAFTSAGDIVNAITSLLQGAMKEGSGVDLTGNLAGLGVSIINAIASAIKKAAGGAAALITAIGNLISTALSGDSLGDLSEVGAAIITAISNAILSAVSSAGEILKAIAGVIGKINWADVGADLGGLATSIIDELVRAIGSEDFSEVVDTIGTTLGRAAGSLATAAASLVTALVKYFLDPNNWGPLADGLRAIIEGAINFVKATYGAGEDGTLIDAILGGKTQNDVVDMGDIKVVYDVEGEINPVGTLFANGYNVDSVYKYLEENGFSTGDIHRLKMLFEADIDFAGGPDAILQQIEEQFPDLAPYFQQHMQNNPIDASVPITISDSDPGGTAQSAVESMQESLDNAGVEYTKEPITVETGANVDIKTTGESGLQTATQEKVDQLIAQQTFTATVDVETAVNVTITDSNGFAVGQEVGESIKKGAASGVVGGASMAFSAGANFAKGYANGINSQISAIANKAAEMVRAAIRAANAAQDSGSPSKIMAKVGNWYGEGYEKGIVDRIRYVKRAASGMASAAIDAMSIGGNQTPAVAMAGSMNARESIDYDRLAYAMSQRPAPVLDLNGKRVAEINSNNTAVAQNSRAKNIALRYGTR